MVQIHDLRLGPDSTHSERFCSLVAIAVLVLHVLFPLTIACLYKTNLKQAVPLPDLQDLMAIEEIEVTYGTINI